MSITTPLGAFSARATPEHLLLAPANGRDRLSIAVTKTETAHGGGRAGRWQVPLAYRKGGRRVIKSDLTSPTCNDPEVACDHAWCLLQRQMERRRGTKHSLVYSMLESLYTLAGVILLSPLVLRHVSRLPGRRTSKPPDQSSCPRARQACRAPSAFLAHRTMPSACFLDSQPRSARATPSVAA